MRVPRRDALAVFAQHALVAGQPDLVGRLGSGACARGRPGAKCSCRPSHSTERSGVRMAQRICGERLANQGATASTM